MLYNNVEVQIIKIAVQNMESLGLVSKDILLKSIMWLKESYEKFQVTEYLEKAVWHIYAYLELGFPYEDGSDLFRVILEYLQLDIEEVFPERKWLYKRVPLNKTNVRNLLGRWNPGLHSMKISDVVEDILNKVSTMQEGEYLYNSGKVISQNQDQMLWENTFKLYIRHEDATFHDVINNKYYVFV